ncbi:MAG: hypothetical protein ACE5Z5_08625 [Candidatus Bathyarchaeia archaeon]
MWETVCFYSLLTTAITGGILFALSIFGIMSVRYVAAYTTTFAIISTYIFYRQIRKTVE